MLSRIHIFMAGALLTAVTSVSLVYASGDTMALPAMPAMPYMSAGAADSVSSESDSTKTPGVGNVEFAVGTNEVKDSFKNVGNVTIDGTLYVYGDFTVIGNVTITGKLKVTGKFDVTGNVTNDKGRLYIMGKKKIVGEFTNHAKKLDRDLSGLDPFLDAELTDEDISKIMDIITKIRAATVSDDKKATCNEVDAYIQDREEDKAAVERWKKKMLARVMKTHTGAITQTGQEIVAAVAPAIIGLSDVQKASIKAKVEKINTEKLKAIDAKIDILLQRVRSKKNVAILYDLKGIIETELSNRETLNIEDILDGSEIPSSTATTTPTQSGSTSSTGTVTQSGSTTGSGSTATGTTASGSTSTGTTSTGSTATGSLSV